MIILTFSPPPLQISVRSLTILVLTKQQYGQCRQVDKAHPATQIFRLTALLKTSSSSAAFLVSGKPRSSHAILR
ncbi:hypothetical protein TNCT_643441 [Trichonephila clavata]|uniref:Uncharacterized protein n=1 Tax=Trichonephila clavata TaxID=2740835 RepID=A0A8X6HQ23_TRICU|nr:hypothetical protein TNCT_643441 [Trichonephila clavata]